MIGHLPEIVALLLIGLGLLGAIPLVLVCGLFCLTFPALIVACLWALSAPTLAEATGIEGFAKVWFWTAYAIAVMAWIVLWSVRPATRKEKA